MAPQSKTTCRKCQRTVIRTVIDGAEVVLDAELISVVTFGRPGSAATPAKETSLARRLHSETCDQHVAEKERQARRAEMRDFNRKNPL